MAQQWNKAFYDRIIADIRQTVIDDCLKLMYEKMQEMIYKTVYNEFSPTSYERRYEDGGLADMGLFDFDIDMNSDGFTLRMFTNVKGAGFDKNYSLDKYIVEGIYQYPNSPKPRDFYQATLDSLIDGGALYGILIDKLKSKGINIK
jgi:hypothetical protein